MKKILALTLAFVMAFPLAACGGKDDLKPSGNGEKTLSSSRQQEQNTSDPGTDETDETPDHSDDSQPSGELDHTSVEWPENEWTAVIPKAEGTVIKAEEQKNTGINGAYVIYMKWTDEEAEAYGQVLIDAGFPATSNELTDGKYYFYGIYPQGGYAVQIGEFGEAENDYVIGIFKIS